MIFDTLVNAYMLGGIVGFAAGGAFILFLGE